jgi:hypothetical protein
MTETVSPVKFDDPGDGPGVVDCSTLKSLS